MKTIKLKLAVQDKSNPVLVDDANNVVVKSINMAWAVSKDGSMIDASPALLAEYMGRTVDVQVYDSGEPVILKNKAIIVL
jgi:hypothetical protein